MKLVWNNEEYITEELSKITQEPEQGQIYIQVEVHTVPGQRKAPGCNVVARTEVLHAHNSKPPLVVLTLFLSLFSPPPSALYCSAMGQSSSTTSDIHGGSLALSLDKVF